MRVILLKVNLMEMENIYDNGDYFIGEYKNSLRNGKGILYYKNGNIQYEGDYVNGKSEGNGKYIWEDGTYYIGEWKNGLFNGKGKEYYSLKYINALFIK